MVPLLMAIEMLMTIGTTALVLLDPWNIIYSKRSEAASFGCREIIQVDGNCRAC